MGTIRRRHGLYVFVPNPNSASLNDAAVRLFALADSIHKLLGIRDANNIVCYTIKTVATLTDDEGREYVVCVEGEHVQSVDPVSISVPSFLPRKFVSEAQQQAMIRAHRRWPFARRPFYVMTGEIERWLNELVEYQIITEEQRDDWAAVLL